MTAIALDILLVEDNPGDADLVREQLADIPAVPCRVHHVSRLSEALSCLATVHYDMALLDLGLPDTQGINTLRGLHQTEQEVPIVVLTGLNDEDVALQAVSEGALDYLVKGEIPRLGLVRALQYAMRRKSAQEVQQQTTRQMTHHINALEWHNRAMGVLSDMMAQLQVCQTVADASDIIAQGVQHVFPETSGALYMLTNNHTRAEAVAVWGSSPACGMCLVPQAWWALHYRQTHSMQGHPTAILCPYVAPHPAWSQSLCLPLVAQGAMHGMLRVCFPPEGAPEPGPEHREAVIQFVLKVHEQVALGLANLTMRQTLYEQSVRDPLTTLFNRRYLEESLHRELRRAARHGTPLGIILLDLDHFKAFNDTFGHQEGDHLLRALGTLLTTCIRGEDIACRYGGEEFVLLLPGAPVDIIRQRADLVRERVKALPVPSAGPQYPPITLSAGVAVCPDHGRTAEALVQAADTALYHAKAAGRDRVVIATHTSTSEDDQHRSSWEPCGLQSGKGEHHV